MIRRTLACGQIAAVLAVVFSGTISKAQEGGSRVYEMDCGKHAVVLCTRSGQWIAGPYRPIRVVHFRRTYHAHRCADQPTCDREWLWNDP